MTQQELLNTALCQSATELGCRPEDLVSGQNTVVRSRPHPRARRHLQLPFYCQLVSYGGGIVASVDPAVEQPVRQYINSCPPEHCFETPQLHRLTQLLAPRGQLPCFMAAYFLPQLSASAPAGCPYPVRLLTAAQLAPLHGGRWPNALCDARRELDVLAVGAYDGPHLIGLAGCSADCDTMWQIGIDVQPGYRRRGVAAALTHLLSQEILSRGKVPFYCAAWSNIPSVKNALRAGFGPAWVELTARPTGDTLAMAQPPL